MEPFDQDRADLRTIRATKNQLSARLAQLQRDRQQLDKATEQAARLDNQEQLRELERQRDQLQRELTVTGNNYLEAKSKAYDDLGKLLIRYKSPQQYITQWDDHLPILLFPVRVETRFASNRQPDTAELWVRIYPDEATVVQHSLELTAAEQAAAHTFWFETWKATTEAAKIGAWTALVGGVGSRRAAWIARATKPTNFAQTDAAVFQFPDLPTLLALGLTPDEVKAGTTYWRSVWFGHAADDAQASLETAVGSSRAALVKSATQPANWAALLGTLPADEFRRVVVLPTPDVPPSHEGQTASYAEVLPDQFVVIGYRGQSRVFEVTGSAIPDRIWLSPNVSPLDGDISREADGQLLFGKDLAWMKHFDESVSMGLGLRINLRQAINQTIVTEQNRSQASADAALRDVTSLGLTRLLVVGINAVDGADNGRVLLEKLFDNHHYGQTGLSFVPQGTPTNNTEGDNAGYRSEPTADESYPLERSTPLFTDQVGVPFHQKVNGQRTAEYLGINSAVFQHTAHSADAELAEAQAMNVALYNATLAYYVDEMMDPLVARDDQHRLFRFFTQYVSARGSLPALRVGRQPYGILPTTAIHRWRWTNGELREGNQFAVPFHEKLLSLIQTFDLTWTNLTKSAPHAGQASAGTDAFLKLLGLQPTSVTYGQRWLYGRQFVRLFTYTLLGVDVSAANVATWNEEAANLLSELGIATEPKLLSKTFAHPAVPLTTVPVIDSLPLSETNPVQPLFTKADGTAGPNYLEWLRQSSLTDSQTENILTDTGVKVAAPKTLLYALLQHAAEQAYWDTAMKLYEDYAVVSRGARREAEVRHVATPPDRRPDVRQWTKPDYLRADMSNIPALGIAGQTMATYLSQRALLPIVRDSNLHLVKEALAKLEKLPTARLERLFAEHIDLCSYRLDGWRSGVVQKRLDYLRYDYQSSNQERDGKPRKGIYLGAFGWLENIKPAPTQPVVNTRFPPELKVSGPVQQAAYDGSFIHAPSLPQAVTAALLRSGYLAHASNNPGEQERLNINLSSARVRQALWYIEGIRKGQELAALLGYQFERSLHDADLDVHIYAFRERFPFKVNETDVPAGQSIEAVSARNVVDGYALANDTTTYPHGRTDLPSAGSPDGRRIVAAIDDIRNAMDAVADLMLAESVHQFVQGNQLTAGASLKAIQEGQNPAIPDLVQTPRNGHAITNRVFLHLDATAMPPANASPRVLADPALNQWLTGLLALPMATTRFIVEKTKTDASTELAEIPLSALALFPIDLINLVDNQQDELAKRILYEYRRTHAVGAAERIQVMFGAPVISAGATSFSALLPLLRHCQQLIRKGRPLTALDYRVPGESKPADRTNIGQVDVPELRGRATALLVALQAQQTAFTLALTTAGTILTTDPVAVKLLNLRNVLVANQVAWETLLKQAADSDIPEAYPDQPVSFTNASVDQDFAYTDALSDLTKLFENQLYGSPRSSASFLFLTQLLTVRSKLDQKIARMTSALTAAGQPGQTDDAQLPLLMQAFEAGLGAAVIIPRFTLHNPTEVRMAFQDQPNTLAYKRDQLLADLPTLGVAASHLLILEEWLQGVSRVRPQMGQLERLRLAAEVSSDPPGTSLAVMQLPGLGQPYWVNLDMPATLPDPDNPTQTIPLVLDRDYLSIVTVGLGATPAFETPQCGLLLDEWTEVIPTQTATTGVAVNYNQPNAESPQCWLLAVSPNLTGAWSWDDLVAILNSTLEQAKSRAVEPDNLATDAKLGQLLPATITAQGSSVEASISLNYSRLYANVIAAANQQ